MRPAPEVVIKVVSRGSETLEAIRVHVDAMGKGTHRTFEDDQGEPVRGKAAADRLIEDWDLEVLLGRRVYIDRPRAKPLKLVHKLVLSMPAGTSPDRLLTAVRNFVRDEFAGHRYALGLHIDEPHPHVHVMVKAVSEQGVRLNIRKPTLRGWREAFAGHLRAQGVEAKATRRAVRCRRPAIRGPIRMPIPADSPSVSYE
jgi:relaxase-like protein